jgi:hypothetical protein
MFLTASKRLKKVMGVMVTKQHSLLWMVEQFENLDM